MPASKSPSKLLDGAALASVSLKVPHPLTLGCGRREPKYAVA
jgi:hypothetical protein